jgi:hypothetical protein
MGALRFVGAPRRIEVPAYYCTSGVYLMVRAEMVLDKVLKILGRGEMTVKSALKIGGHFGVKGA